MLCTDFFLRMHESNIVQYGSPYTANCATYDFPHRCRFRGALWLIFRKLNSHCQGPWGDRGSCSLLVSNLSGATLPQTCV